RESRISRATIASIAVSRNFVMGGLSLILSMSLEFNFYSLLITQSLVYVFSRQNRLTFKKISHGERW
ncbi:MAG: hypothetical protein ACK513_08385, partial [Aphanizomenon sp.]